MDKEELINWGVEEETADRIIACAMRAAEEYESRIAKMQYDNEVEKLLNQSGARNVTAVRALLSGGDIESVKEEIAQLKKSEETRFLFEKTGSFEPKRSGERLPDARGNDYAIKLGEARKKNNTLEAIRIKQQAASEGIMLL